MLPYLFVVHRWASHAIFWTMPGLLETQEQSPNDKSKIQTITLPTMQYTHIKLTLTVKACILLRLSQV